MLNGTTHNDTVGSDEYFLRMERLPPDTASDPDPLYDLDATHSAACRRMLRLLRSGRHEFNESEGYDMVYHRGPWSPPWDRGSLRSREIFVLSEILNIIYLYLVPGAMDLRNGSDVPLHPAVSKGRNI